MVKNNLAHGDGYETLDLGAAMSFDRSGHVYIRKDDSPEDSSLRVRIARQH
jgi:hypothetical protein